MKKQAKGYRLIFGYLGIFLILIGIITMLPLILLAFYPGESNCWLSFFIPGMSTIGLGFLLFLLIYKRERTQLEKFQDSALLVMIWLSAILIGSVPFMLRGYTTPDFAKYRMNFSDAVFESTSGYTSTGLTVFNFDMSYPGYHIFTFYRSILLLFGGIGLVLIVTSAISDKYGLKLYTAEGHNDKLMPNLAKSARLILLIYIGYIILGFLSYWLIGGMEPFDAINHAIAAIATGGFSTREGGIPEIINEGGYNSITGWPVNGLAINITSVILMLLGGTNFVLHLFLFKGKLKKILKDSEIKFFLILSIIMIPLFYTSIFTSLSQQLSVLDSWREGTYLYFSALTTTGFSTTTDIKQLGEAALILSIIAMTIGGGMGSTAGGVKQYRFVVAYKALYWSLRDRLSSKRKFYPHTIYRLGESKEINKLDFLESYGYLILYVTIMMVGGTIITILGKNTDGYSAIECIFEFASALSGTGLSVGVTTGVGLPIANAVAIRWVLIFGMFAGRLELICIYLAFYRFVRDILRRPTY